MKQTRDGVCWLSELCLALPRWASCEDADTNAPAAIRIIWMLGPSITTWENSIWRQLVISVAKGGPAATLQLVNEEGASTTLQVSECDP